ncbi:hypothetical protein Anas_12516, partial [Armadillidium nasatum]
LDWQIRNGVRQGGILCPLLFCVNINELTDKISEFKILKLNDTINNCISLQIFKLTNTINISISFQALKLNNAINIYFKSSDFKVVNVDENQWNLQDYGYYLKANELIQTNLTLVSEDHIRNPVPFSVLLNDEILEYKAVHQNFVMLSIVIAFIVIFAIYGIVATYHLIIWRRHYDQMTLELWNKVQSRTDNNFDNFVPSEYANAVTNYNATPF